MKHLIYCMSYTFAKASLQMVFYSFAPFFAAKDENTYCLRKKKISVMQFLASRAQKMTAMLIFLIRKIAPKNDAIFAPANGG